MIENGTEKAASFVILFLEGKNKIKKPYLGPPRESGLLN
jgi:hypothetical protein